MGVRREKQAREQPAWTIDYKDENGLRCRIRVHGTKSIVQMQYGQILKDIEKRKLGLLHGERYMHLKDLAMKYLKASEINGKSPLTVTRIRNATDALLRVIGENTLITEVTEQILEDYKQKRLSEYTPRGTKLTPSGLNSELKHQKAMFNWAVKTRLLIRSPFLGVPLLRIQDRPVRFLSSNEIKSLYIAIKGANDEETRDLVTFYLQTGARRSEILPPKFSWEQVSYERRLIVLVGKNGKRRTLPLNDILIDLLKRRQNGIHPFDISGDRVYRLIKKYYRIAEIANANVHTLRKTCGSLLIENGVDVYRVSKWLGHSSVSVTEQHYIDLLKKDYEDISLLLNRTSIQFEPEK